MQNAHWAYNIVKFDLSYVWWNYVDNLHFNGMAVLIAHDAEIKRRKIVEFTYNGNIGQQLSLHRYDIHLMKIKAEDIRNLYWNANKWTNFLLLEFFSLYRLSKARQYKHSTHISASPWSCLLCGQSIYGNVTLNSYITTVFGCLLLISYIHVAAGFQLNAKSGRFITKAISNKWFDIL